MEQFNGALKMRLRDGWVVVSDGPTGVQLIAPKKMGALSKIGTVVGGLLLLFAWPATLVLWALVTFDYFVLTHPEKEFLARPAQ